MKKYFSIGFFGGLGIVLTFLIARIIAIISMILIVHILNGGENIALNKVIEFIILGQL